VTRVIYINIENNINNAFLTFLYFVFGDIEFKMKATITDITAAIEHNK